MANKILENVHVGDHVELYTIKGDLKQGTVTAKNDEDEILGIRIDGGNVESRYKYALIAGCEITATANTSVKLQSKQSETVREKDSSDIAIDKKNQIEPEKQKDLPKVPQPPVKLYLDDITIQVGPDIFGKVVKALPDYKDPTQCYQWVIETDNGEQYRFNKFNVSDYKLLMLLNEKFEKKIKNDEIVRFQIKHGTDKFGKKFQGADYVRLKDIFNFTKQKNHSIQKEPTEQINKEPTEQINKNKGPTEQKYREALLQFGKGGKEHDKEILPVFLEYFEINPSKELANNICQLLIRSDDPAHTIDFIEKTKNIVGLTDVECLHNKYQVYRKINEPEKAYEISQSILTMSDITIPQRRHYIELAIKYSLSCQRYSETIAYCEMWLALGLGKADDKNVSNVYRRRQICLTAAECVVKLRNSGNYKPSKKLLEEINADEQAAIILKSEAGEQLYDHIFGDLDYMGVFAKNQIEGLNLLEAPARLKLLRQIIDPETGHFRGEPDKPIRYSALNIAKGFTSNLFTEKPWERYESCIYAARVLYDALKEVRNRNEADNVLEPKMCQYLAKAMASYGDFAIGVSRTAIKEEARLYYTESIKYASGDEQDRVNAIIRCVLSVFVEREDIPVTMQGDNNLGIRQISDYLNNPDYSNKLNTSLLLGVIARIIARVPPNQTNKIQSALIDAIFQSQSCMVIAQDLFTLADFVQQGRFTKEKFLAALDVFRKKYSELENAFIRLMERVSEQVYFKREWIEDTQKNLDDIKIFVKYMDDFDKENCYDFMRELLDIANKYYNAEHYEEREDCLKSMISRIKDRVRSIRETPAQYSYERLLKVLNKWKEVSVRGLHELYANNPPELDCEILGNSNISLNEDGVFKLPIIILNQKEKQKADDVEVFSFEDKDGTYEFISPESGSSRMIKGGGQKDCVLHFRLKDMELEAVTVYITVTYAYKDENGGEKKERKQYPLTVFFGENREVKFDNPYTAYTESGAVQDPSMTFGRDELINDIITMLKGNDTTPLRSKMLLLYGQKRAGKSTVLLYLTNEIRKKVPDAIVVDFGDISDLSQNKTRFEEFYYKKFFYLFSAELRERHNDFSRALLTEGIVIPNEDRLNDAADGRYEMGKFFKELNFFIASNDAFSCKTVVLLLDEFTYLYGWMKKGEVDKDFMKYWKAMISEYKLVAIAAAQDYIGDFIATYKNQFGTTELIPVDYLVREDVKEMIRRPFADNSFWAAFDHKMGEEAINRIMRLTAGNAYFSIIFLDRLVEYLNKTNQPIVMPITVETVLRKELLSGNNPLQLEHFESLYNDDGDIISDPDRPMHNLALLWAVAQQCERGAMCAKEDIRIPEKVKDASKIKERSSFLIDKMVRRRVLTREEGRDAYQIRVDMFREWLLTNCGADLINEQKQTTDN